MPAITMYVPDQVFAALEAECERLGEPTLTPTKLASKLLAGGLCSGDTLIGAVLERVRLLPGVHQSTGQIANSIDPMFEATPAKVDAALLVLEKLARVRAVALRGGGNGWTLAP